MANIKFSGFTAPGGSFTPARVSTYFVGYDNSGGPDNVQFLVSDVEGILNWPEYNMRLQSTTLNPTLEYVQTTGYSYGTASGTLQFQGGTNVTITRQSDSKLKIDATDTNDTSLPIKNGAGTVEFTATDTTGLRIVGGGSVTATYIAGSQQVALTGTDTNFSYALSTADNNPNIDIELTGSGGGSDSGYEVIAGSNITLTENGSNTGYTIAAANDNTTYQLVNNTGGGNQCVIELQTSTSTPSGNVTLSPGSNITIANPAANFYTISAAASTSWTQQADFGSNNTINNGDTLDIAGGVYIKTTSNATSGKEVEIDHSLTTRSDTTSTASPGSGGTFTVVDSVTSNNTGHVTAVNVKTVTMPTVTPGGGGLNPTVKTTSYTASADDFIICNVNGTLDITLPAAGSSSVGDIIGVKYASQNAQTDKLRVFTNASGDKIDGTDRSSSPLPIPSVNTYYEFIYGSANNWYIK